MHPYNIIFAKKEVITGLNHSLKRAKAKYYAQFFTMNVKLSALFVITLVLITQNVLSQTATAPSAGDGSSGSPYEIANLDNLYWLTQTSSVWGDHFIQTADIDASSTSGWDSGNGFTPIGTSGTNFTGSYDGNGYAITWLTINRSSTSNIGMFSFIDGATLTNIGLIDVNFDGNDYVGGLVGEAYSASIITRNYVTGTVSGARHVGGIIGNYEPGAAFIATSDFSENYSEASVNGTINAGGIVGFNLGTIRNCYAIGDVRASTRNAGGIAGRSNNTIATSYASSAITGNQSGGLIGENYGIITNSFWDTNASGKSNGIGSDNNSQSPTGLTTSEMRIESNFSGFDFTNTWAIEKFVSSPYLQSLVPDSLPGVDILASLPSGEGTQTSPYLISDLSELRWLSQTEAVWDSTFQQTADIDASPSSGWDSGNGFTPIGSITTHFTGIYDGDNYTITGLYVDRSSADYIGMFGYAVGANLKNIHLTGLAVTGNDWVGGIAGYMDGDSLSNSSVSGNVSGRSNIGGLAGQVSSGALELNSANIIINSDGNLLGGLVGLNNGDIFKSYASVIFSSPSPFVVGGITGALETNGSISDSYATGDVQGYELVGGISGTSEGDISNSYFSGTISAIEGFGGVLGRYSNGTLSGVYWDTDRSGITFAFGFGSGQPAMGYTSSQMRVESNFPEFDFDTNWGIASGFSEPYLRDFAPDSINGFPTSYFPEGSGSEGDPYLISTLDNLYWLSQNETVWDSAFVQTADIDASSTSGWDNGNGFSPIGNNNPNSFTGSYNGANYSITELTINRDSTDYVALFGSAVNATLTNINLLDAEIHSADSRFVGALAGSVNGTVIITGNTSTGNVSGKQHVGGLIGSLAVNQLSDPLSNNHSSVNVVATDEAVGGLVGTFSTGLIENSFATGDVTGKSNVGGLIGAAHDTVTTSYATGTVTGSGQTVGGLIGQNTFYTSKSYATGNVQGSSDYVGGLIGENVGDLEYIFATGDVSGSGNQIGGLTGQSASGDITNCFSTGEVNGNINVGGLNGAYYGGTLSNCFATGSVNGSSNSGGFIGENTGTVIASYWNTQTSGLSTGIGVNAGSGSPTNLTIGQMADSSNFSGWDFASDTVWTIDQGFTFPYLKNLGDHRMVVATIDSGEGWRMIGAPGNVTYSDLLDPIWTQGYEGSDAGTGFSSNVYFYEEATQSWSSPSSASDYFGTADSTNQNTALNGILLYVYGDDDNDGSDDPWPKYLVSENNTLNESFDVSLGYTNNVSADSAGWNLISNPYPTSLDWTEVVTNNDITNTFPVAYIWDDSLNAGNGAYRINYGYPLPPGLPQDLIFDGAIPAMQAFWVKATSSGASLSFKPDYQGDSQFTYKQSHPEEKYAEVPWLSLRVEYGELSDQVMVFGSGEHIPSFNTPKLKTIASRFVELSFETQEGNWTSRSLTSDNTEIPLRFSSTETGSFIFSWEADNSFFEQYEVLLLDYELGTSLMLELETTVSIELSDVDQPQFALKIIANNTVGNEQDSDLPTMVTLNQNYPNPFNPSTIIGYQLPKRAFVELQVFDVMGRKVATLVDQSVDAGVHEVQFEASHLASGLYFYRLKTGNMVLTKKLTLVK
jgi:hypothetical protein